MRRQGEGIVRAVDLQPVTDLHGLVHPGGAALSATLVQHGNLVVLALLRITDGRVRAGGPGACVGHHTHLQMRPGFVGRQFATRRIDKFEGADVGRGWPDRPDPKLRGRECPDFCV